MLCESVDQRRLSRAWGTGYSDTMRAAGQGVQLRKRILTFWGIVLYEGEKTGERKSVTGSNSLSELQALSPLPGRE